MFAAYVHYLILNCIFSVKILKKKTLQYVTKVSTVREKQIPKAEVNPFEESLNELLKEVNELDKTVEEYKQNLDKTLHLQQAMEEVGNVLKRTG